LYQFLDELNGKYHGKITEFSRFKESVGLKSNDASRDALHFGKKIEKPDGEGQLKWNKKYESNNPWVDYKRHPANGTEGLISKQMTNFCPQTQARHCGIVKIQPIE
jgi:hypothetical protein